MYVSDCIGVRWVGLVLMTYGVSSGVSGFVSGRLVKYLPQYLITYSVLTVYLALLVFLLVWEPAPLHYVIFTVAFLFGVCEGSINCITTSELNVELLPKMYNSWMLLFILNCSFSPHSLKSAQYKGT